MSAAITASNGRLLDAPQAACWAPFYEGDRQGTKKVAGTLWERLTEHSDPLPFVVMSIDCTRIIGPRHATLDAARAWSADFDRDNRALTFAHLLPRWDAGVAA